MGIRKYNVNDNYFKTWSHNMAYILGFWFADGCIMKRCEQYRFNIGQNKKDKYLLKQMLVEMGSNYPMFFDKKHDFCSFQDKGWHGWLDWLGLKNKSYSCKITKMY